MNLVSHSIGWEWLCFLLYIYVHTLSRNGTYMLIVTGLMNSDAVSVWCVLWLFALTFLVVKFSLR